MAAPGDNPGCLKIVKHDISYDAKVFICKSPNCIMFDFLELHGFFERILLPPLRKRRFLSFYVMYEYIETKIMDGAKLNDVLARALLQEAGFRHQEGHR